MVEIVQFWLAPVVSLLAIVDPVAAVPTFLALTSHDTPEHRRLVIRNACIVCACVMLLFALGGKLIFQVFAITLPAFRIAGGMILAMTAFDMLRAERRRTTTDEIEEGLQKIEIAITPMAVPILAGPGALSTVIVMMGKAKTWTGALPVVFAILMTALASFVVLRLSEGVLKALGRTGINLLSRLMGILLMTVSIQFVIDGVRELVVVR